MVVVVVVVARSCGSVLVASQRRSGGQFGRTAAGLLGCWTAGLLDCGDDDDDEERGERGEERGVANIAASTTQGEARALILG